MSAPMSNDPFPVAPRPDSAAWEDVLDIFYAPTQVFERRRDGKYWVPLLILCALSVALYFLSVQVNDAIADAEFTRAMAQQPNKLTPEQMAQARAFAEKFKSLIVYITPIFIIIGAMVSGLMIWLLGMGMGGKLTFAQGVTVAVLANYPEALGRAVVGAQGLFLDTATVTSKYSFATSVARFMSPDANKYLLKLGALADPFVLWGAVLLFLGVFVIGRMEKEKAAVLAIIHAMVTALLIR